MEWISEDRIDIRTVKAVDIIVSFLTPEEKALLDITLNGKVVTVAEQLCSRWWSQIPISENPIVFKSEVAQILNTNKRWLVLMGKLKEQDFLLKLLDPENYSEKQSKGTSGKTLDKRQIDKDTDHANLMRTISRNITGESGVNRDADYSAEWDRADRKRLDKMLLRRPNRSLITTETGLEDDTPEDDQLDITAIENINDVNKFIGKKERIDSVQARRTGDERPTVTFGDNHEEIEEKRIDIFNIALSHATNSTLGDQAVTENTFVEATKRQGFITLRERIILADAINNIHNVEFPNIHEKIFKLLDPLFKHTNKVCQ